MDEKMNLIKTISDALSIADFSNIDENDTLVELGMDSLTETEIQQILLLNFKLVLTLVELRKCTFKKLEQMLVSQKSEVQETKKSDQSYFEIKQLVFEDPMIKMESKTNVGTPIFILPGIEGYVDNFVALTKELAGPVYIFPNSRATVWESITDLASFFIKQMKKVQPKGPYNVIGYSFGAMVAFELVVQLERELESVKLVLLDGSPDYLKLYSKQFVSEDLSEDCGKLSDKSKKSLAFFVSQINPSKNIIQEYNSIKTLENDDEVFKQIYLDMETEFRFEDVVFVAKTILKRIKMSFLHKIDQKYKGYILLIRASDGQYRLDQSYGLEKICENTVEVQVVSGDHQSILKGDTVKELARTIIPVFC